MSTTRAILEILRRPKLQTRRGVIERWKKKKIFFFFFFFTSNPLLPFTPNSLPATDDGGGVGRWSYYLRVASPP